MRISAVLVIVLLGASISYAQPPDGAARGVREGANHRLGDDSFVARFGREPGPGDGEALRMRTHLTYVRAWLGERPATRPELAETRARLLGYLDDYIAKGTTPVNTRLPWRNPVFIDERGTICAVGYLIERSAGRAVAEQIAAAHRFDYLEDIAAAMPVVRAWIEGSGLALEELASIQPGYPGAELPPVEQWVPALTARLRSDSEQERAESWQEHGRVRRGQMQGKWTKTTEEGTVIGSGTLVRGAGTWRSTYDDGTLLAEGPYAGSHPHGTWRFFHRSGNLAAEGTFEHGWRHGRWTFFHDTKAATPIARGKFDHNSFIGRWRHFDEAGQLIATTHDDSPETWGADRGYLMTIVGGSGGVQQQAHLGGRGRLFTFALGKERIYVQPDQDVRGDAVESIFDVDGNRLTRLQDGSWEAAPCKWSRYEKRAARAGDVAQLNGLLTRWGSDWNPVEHPCEEAEARAVPADRGKKLDELLAARGRVRAPVPAFVEGLASRGEVAAPSEGEDEDETKRKGRDLTELLAGTIDRYIQWPHINELFLAVYPTLANERPYMNN